jgi:hypothetical protein
MICGSRPLRLVPFVFIFPDVAITIHMMYLLFTDVASKQKHMSIMSYTIVISDLQLPPGCA